MPLRRMFLLVIIIVPLFVLAISVLNVALKSTSFALETELSGNLLTIKGTSSLPNRSVLIFEVLAKDPEIQQRDGIYATGIMTLSREKYSTQVDLSLIPKQILIVRVRFEINPQNPIQPPAVTGRYGTKGESLSGEHLVNDGEYRYLQIENEIDTSQ